ncbi:MAG TPA: ABC transporter ATP-binding protein [Terriglobales bacterium]|nr:ABC transporter ATP-binding protein [Terriglobales bacterium]
MRRPWQSDLALFRRLWRQSQSCHPHLIGIFGLSLVAVPLSLLFPLPLKIVVDSVLGDRPMPRPLPALFPSVSHTGVLAIAIGMLIVVGAALHLQALASWYLQTFTGEKLVWDFRARLLQHAQRLSLTFHRSTGSSDFCYRIQQDATQIQNIALQGVLPIVNSVLTLAGMFLVIARLDPAMALMTMVVGGILIALTQLWSRTVRRRSTEIKRLDSHAMAVVQEVLTSLPVVMAFGQEHREYQRFVRQSDQRMRGQVQLSTLQGFFNLLTGMTIAAATAGALWLGVRHVRAGLLTTGELLVVMAYLAQLYDPLKTLTGKITDMQGWMVSIERSFELLDQVPEIADAPHPVRVPRARGGVTFDRVSFRYPNSDTGLRDVSFTVSPGTRVGIVGPTGAGKTTLINLLARFYDPNSGVVRLDGVDLRRYKLEDLRRQFAIVLQEPMLFSTSIAENIAYGRPSASDEDIVEAARAASADDFIRRLRQGYDTPVGEGGAQLSGGERQRISLARAFLRNSPILILDEPTSSVDTKTEAAIMEATETLMRGRTTFMIAHRLSTLKSCDVMLRLERGALVSVEPRFPEPAEPHLVGVPGARPLALEAAAGD